MKRLILTLLAVTLPHLGLAQAQEQVEGVAEMQSPETTEAPEQNRDSNQSDKEPGNQAEPDKPDPLSDSIAKAQLLFEAGAPSLAQAILEKNRPDPAVESDKWILWARTFHQLYLSGQRWEAAATLFSELPTEIPQSAKRELKTLAIRAWLQAGEGAKARQVIRSLLFGGDVTPAEISIWRRLNVNALIVDHLIEDARLAMIRYQLELRPDDPEWHQRHARLLLVAEEPALAAVEVASDQTFYGRLLRIIARLRNSNYTPNQAIDGLLKLEKELKAYPSLRYETWAAITEAAERGGNNPLRVEALEKALNLNQHSRPDQMVTVELEALLGAYGELASEMGNRSGLLQGEDEAWWALSETLAPDFPLAARGIYAQLASTSSNEEMKQKSSAALSASLITSGLEPLLYQLFSPDSQLGDLDALPPEIRSDLSARALKRGEIDLASRLVNTIESPPEAVSSEAWALHKARLALYAGDVPIAVDLIAHLINGNESIERPLGDRLLQLVFDLQSVDRHPVAIQLIEQMKHRLVDPDHQREILFWKGDSLSALKHFTEAAEQYLLSAIANGQGFDQWGQSARYRAAEALVKAGHKEDARSIYLSLLTRTQDPAKQHQLKQRLQRLWLK